jgi:hypothetical protein
MREKRREVAAMLPALFCISDAFCRFGYEAAVFFPLARHGPILGLDRSIPDDISVVL